MGTAPTAYSDVGRETKPAGKNITEGGFDADAPNASFNGDVGGKNDPGRAALGEFQRKAAEPVTDAGSGTKHGGGSGDGQFGALGGDASA